MSLVLTCAVMSLTSVIVFEETALTATVINRKIVDPILLAETHHYAVNGKIRDSVTIEKNDYCRLWRDLLRQAEDSGQTTRIINAKGLLHYCETTRREIYERAIAACQRFKFPMRKRIPRTDPNEYEVGVHIAECDWPKELQMPTSGYLGEPLPTIITKTRRTTRSLGSKIAIRKCTALWIK